MSVSRPTIEVINKIAENNNFRITEVSPLAGGDINQVFLISTGTSEKRVVKLNSAEKFPGMFEAEKAGLEALAAPEVIDVPQVFATGVINGTSYLLLEYRETGNPEAGFAKKFGKQLAQLHKISAKEFGFERDNYIGILPQPNHSCKTASEFYITQRLEPQFALARKKGFQLGSTSSLYKACEELLPKEPPALVHGDLWSGNYLVNKNGQPCLIDPATAFAPREMDLGMMKLFGGFDPAIFREYHKIFPLEDGFEQRLPLWQLYYLLVHLNIFGEGYKPQVISIISRYS